MAPSAPTWSTRLDASELDEFEAHLAVCPTCSREVVEFCETAAELSLLATVAAAATRTAQPASCRRSRRSGRYCRSAGTDVAHREPTPRRALAASRRRHAPPKREPIDELALRRQRRRARVLTAAVAAVMVVALGLGGGWSRPGAHAAAVPESAEQDAGNPAVQRLRTSQVVSTTIENGGQVSFVVSKEPEPGHVRRPPTCRTPGPGKRYQLWTIERPVPARAGQPVRRRRQRPRSSSAATSRDAAGLGDEHRGRGPRPGSAHVRHPGQPPRSRHSTSSAPGRGARGVTVARDRLCVIPIRPSDTRATLEKRRDEVAAMFDRVAARYDLANDVLSLGQDRAWRRLDRRGGAAPARAADPGSGRRYRYLERAVRRTPGRWWCPTDLSLGMLQVGKAAPAGV